MAMTRLIYSVLFFSMTLGACGSNDLNRDKARELISGMAEFDELRTNIPTWLERDALTYNMTNQGIYVVTENGKGLSPDAASHISELGEKAIISKGSQKIEIEITGLTGDRESAERIAEFEWRYEDLPAVLKRFALGGGNGKASLTLYDDGWRVTNLALKLSDEGYPLTEADREEMFQDINRAEEFRLELAAKYRPLWEKRGDLIEQVDFVSRKQTQSVRIFTNGVEYPSPVKGRFGTPEFMWFGDISNAQQGAFDSIVRLNAVVGRKRFTNVPSGQAQHISEMINRAHSNYHPVSGSSLNVAQHFYNCDFGDMSSCEQIGFTIGD